MIRVIFICFSFFLLIEEVFGQRSPQFIFSQEQIVVKGFDQTKELQLFTEHLDFLTSKKATPILTYISHRDDSSIITPIVPLNVDQAYTLKYDQQIKHFFIPISGDYKRVEVVEIHPQVKQVPSNLLKWYIKFSGPVSLTNLYEHIYLTDALNEVVDRALLPLENVLVSEDGTLITLWMEPGRQKRGLGPSNKLGQIFSSGSEYTLHIKETLRDIKGIALAYNVTHDFKVRMEDRSKPRISDFIVKAPQSKSLSHLALYATYPLDYGSALNGMKVYQNKQQIRGEWKLERLDTKLSFYPELPWRKGSYQIVFDSAMEDLAGNNFIKLFDVESDSRISNKTPELELSFIIE